MPVLAAPIAHDEKLSLVDHLDELRTRLIISILALVIAFGFAFWQNNALLNVLNKPLNHATAHATKSSKTPVGAQARFDTAQRRALQANVAALGRLSHSRAALSVKDRAALATAASANAVALRAAPRKPPVQRPVTLGLAEPFTQTLAVAAYFALLLALPVILFQAYAFILPAVSPRERRVVTPLLTMIPLLFIVGVVFAYFLVLPAAIGFLQGFNRGQFEVLVQAKQYYTFTIMTMAAMGLLFQIPVGILALTRLGMVTPRQLRQNRRYAIVGIAIVAALLPGVDPVTTLIEMIPLLLLYELSILLASWAMRSVSADEG
jgi:sec-independent protein translocase protein TatC